MKQSEMHIDEKTHDTWGIQTFDCAQYILELPRVWLEGPPQSQTNYASTWYLCLAQPQPNWRWGASRRRIAWRRCTQEMIVRNFWHSYDFGLIRSPLVSQVAVRHPKLKCWNMVHIPRSGYFASSRGMKCLLYKTNEVKSSDQTHGIFRLFT